jgi:hypothetical protein
MAPGLGDFTRAFGHCAGTPLSFSCVSTFLGLCRCLIAPSLGLEDPVKTLIFARIQPLSCRMA